MIVFASILASTAREAGIKVPDDPEKLDSKKYPHWNVFLGASLPRWAALLNNAKLIASISDEEIKTITYQQLLNKGLKV